MDGCIRARYNSRRREKLAGRKRRSGAKDVSNPPAYGNAARALPVGRALRRTRARSRETEKGKAGRGLGSRQLIRSKRAPVAQMDRAADFESVGREFESPQARHVFNEALSMWSEMLEGSRWTMGPCFRTCILACGCWQGIRGSLLTPSSEPAARVNMQRADLTPHRIPRSNLLPDSPGGRFSARVLPAQFAQFCSCPRDGPVADSRGLGSLNACAWSGLSTATKQQTETRPGSPRKAFLDGFPG